jgi:hypothetical protein
VLLWCHKQLGHNNTFPCLILAEKGGSWDWLHVEIYLGSEGQLSASQVPAIHSQVINANLNTAGYKWVVLPL